MKLNTPYPFVGSTKDFVFYESKHGYIVARKSHSINKKRIDNDPKFAKTKANYLEFRHVMKSAALIREAFRDLLKCARDGDTATRMSSIMFRIIKADRVNERGRRNISKGLIDRLQGFEFNRQLHLAHVLFAPYTVSVVRSSGEVKVEIDSFKPQTALHAPKGATHFRLTMCAAEFDFESLDERNVTATTGELPLNDEPVAHIQLDGVLKANSANIIMVALSLEFFEEEELLLSILKPTALAIVAISKP
jgi:hypothetical protein